MQAPYLRISIGDSDFTSYFNVLGQAIYDMIEYVGFPKYTDQLKVTDQLLQRLIDPIAKLWSSFHGIYEVLTGKPAPDYYSYILGALSLQVVNYEDIEFDSAEGIYVALFKILDGEHKVFLGR